MEFVVETYSDMKAFESNLNHNTNFHGWTLHSWNANGTIIIAVWQRARP
jgi:hypothetical protein